MICTNHSVLPAEVAEYQISISVGLESVIFLCDVIFLWTGQWIFLAGVKAVNNCNILDTSNLLMSSRRYR